jgi:hypothetical protein
MRFKLLAQHYINDRLLEEGTIIGEGTEVPFLDAKGNPLPPSDQMEGLDEESQKLVDSVREKSWNIDNIGLTMQPAGGDPTVQAVDPVDPSKAKGK